MQKLTLAVMVFLLFLSQGTHVFANSENVSKEIERIEIGENSKTIYYKDGSKEMFVTASVNVGFSVGTAHVIEVPTPPFPIPIDKIFRIIRQILENIFNASGVGGFLLAWKIWNLIKGLRRGRPRDYHGYLGKVLRAQVSPCCQNTECITKPLNFYVSRTFKS